MSEINPMQPTRGLLRFRDDIYYKSEYASLYVADESSLFLFDYSDGDSVFYNVAIKRPITKISGESCSELYFDLETPYGYGGFYSTSHDPVFIERAMTAYRERCLEEKIIAEFIRFHPFNPSPSSSPQLFDFLSKDRDVVVVDLIQSKEERWSSYHKNTRNILRKCDRVLQFEESTNLEMFMDLYRQTMLKNKADEFYYFNKKYYRDLLTLDEVYSFQVSFENRIIAMAFFMVGSELAHYHLSANNTEFRRLNGNYYMLDQAFGVAQKFGAHHFILGGGRTPESDDPLLRFKQKFSRQAGVFNIAGIKHNEEKYDEYVARWDALNSGERVNFFLKYRLKGG